MVQSGEMLNISAIDSLQRENLTLQKIIEKQEKTIKKLTKKNGIDNEKIIKKQEKIIEKLTKKYEIVNKKFLTLYKANWFRNFQSNFHIWLKKNNLKPTDENRLLYRANLREKKRIEIYFKNLSLNLKKKIAIHDRPKELTMKIME